MGFGLELDSDRPLYKDHNDIVVKSTIYRIITALLRKVPNTRLFNVSIRPNLICPEFLWQEKASLENVTAISQEIVSTPELKRRTPITQCTGMLPFGIPTLDKPSPTQSFQPVYDPSPSTLHIPVILLKGPWFWV